MGSCLYYTPLFKILSVPLHVLSATGSYPHSEPEIELPDHLAKNLGLYEHLLATARENLGSPMLYHILDAAKEWVASHPLSLHPYTAVEQKVHKEDPSVGRSQGTVCKFYRQGKCKFGDKCRNLHASASRQQPGTHIRNSGEQVPSTLSDCTQVKKNEESTGLRESGCTPQGDPSAATKSKERGGGGGGGKGREAEDGQGTKKQPMRQATDVISRILWDPDLPSEQFTVGYLDRFTGIIEKPFSAFSWEDLATVGANVLAVPKHRIQYFKFRSEIVWDKRNQTDNFFGSRGGTTIQEIIGASASSEITGAIGGGREEESPEVSQEPMTLECEEEEDVPAGRALVDRNRPTHFVCVHITSDEIKSNVQRIQDHMTGHTPQLAEGCIPVSALHVTLCMVRLVSEEHIAKAKAVLMGAQQQFIHVLPRCVQLQFTGVDNFRERLAYVKLRPNPALDRFVFFLIDQFQKAGLRTPGNHDPYTPHMTIVKLSRSLQQQLHSTLISRAAYAPFQDTNVGRDNISALHLCSMAAPKQDDGFYLRLGTVTNSLSGLPPVINDLLLQCLQDLVNKGVLVESERGQLVESIQKEGGTESSFDAAVEELLRLGSEETMCSSPRAFHRLPHVVILRGLPGSGKSFLAHHCSEKQSNPAKVAVCGADEYFMEGDSYKFNPDLVPKAHAHCLGQFLNALATGTKELVVIDNTNTQVWEYQVYCYLCEILGLKCHILEIPCFTATLAEMYSSRNVHSIDATVATKIYRRWETDDRAVMVPPSVVYPKACTPAVHVDFSLLSLCLQEDSPLSNITSISLLSSVTAVYTAIFLTSESQWKLVSSVQPTHSSIFATHVTLSFKPSSKDILCAKIGRKVTVAVTGSAENGKVQAALVRLPKGLTCSNDHPHVTISASDGVSPKAANAMLQSRPVRAAWDNVELEGVVGVVVRETTDMDRDETEEPPDASKLPTFVVTSDTDLHQYVLPKLFQPTKDVVSSQEVDPSASELYDSPICTGHQKLTQLFVFDFDGTLFDAPEPKEGRELYEKCTGKRWPHRGWLGWPESLLPPMKIRNGPALAEFRQHLGRAGSVTLVLTGRIERTRSAVESVLANNQVFPHRLIMKPNVSSENTPTFKARIFRELLDEFPDVSLVKFWDDIPENLAAVHRLSKSTAGRHNAQFELIDATRMYPITSISKQGKKVTTQQQPLKVAAPSTQTRSVLESHLETCGLLPTTAYVSAAHTGIEFLVEQFAKVIDFSSNPTLLAYPFGSFPLCRQSDIDLCFLAPPTFTPGQCVEQLSSQLERCGVSHVHAGHSTRCPRLKVMLQFPSTPAINYDIVFAIVAREKFLSLAEGDTQPPPPILSSFLQPGDSASKVALSGPLFLHQVEGDIAGVVSKQQFGAVVEMMVQVLIAHRQKGNAYHCMRTFHVVQLLTEFIKSHKAQLATPVNCDSLFKDVVGYVSSLPESQFQKLFGDFVPREYIPKVIHAFSIASRETAYDDFPSLTCYEEMVDRSTAFPPDGYSPVEFSISGNRDVALWRLYTVIEARLPSYIRQLLSLGLEVLPSGNPKNERKFVFAVPQGKTSKQTLQQVLRPFWSELVEFRKQGGVHVELSFGQGAANMQHESTPPGGVVEQIVQFHSSPSAKSLQLPASLSAYERLQVHETAERLGLHHSTVGKGKDRHIVLTRK